MGRYFGTDGVRGVANSELDALLAFKIGAAAAYALTQESAHGRKAKLLIGKDTRVSSDMLENALVAGICSVGADVELLGVIPHADVIRSKAAKRERHTQAWARWKRFNN